jgi:hypothetical protein
MDSEYRIFSGRIYKIGVIRFVDVPAEISRQMGKGAHVPVAGTVAGAPLRTTLVSRGKGAYRLAIHGDIRKKLRIDTGAVVEVALCRDKESREPELPPALALALRNAPKAQRVFRGMTTALRRQIVRYITAVKSQDTLERRIAKFVERLEKREPRKVKKARTGGRKKARK